MLNSLKSNVAGTRGSFAIGLPPGDLGSFWFLGVFWGLESDAPQTIFGIFGSLGCFGAWNSEMLTSLKRNLGGARGSLAIGLPPRRSWVFFAPWGVLGFGIPKC